MLTGPHIDCAAVEIVSCIGFRLMLHSCGKTRWLASSSSPFLALFAYVLMPLRELRLSNTGALLQPWVLVISERRWRMGCAPACVYC